jgi:hypothetical protein
MKHAFALMVATVGLAACSETVVSPGPDRRSPTPSFSATGAEAPAGSAAALLGDQAAPESVGAQQAAPACAEGVVLPNAYTNMMGESNNTFPHGWANMRYQQVFLEAEMGDVTAVGGICLRRDEVSGGPAGTQQLTVKLGPTALNHITLTPVFDANYSAPPTTVFSGAVNLPASSGGGTPEDFYISIEFTEPYLHSSGSNVIVEIVNTSQFSLVHFDDFCFISATCTTRRIFAFSATAPVGFTDGPFFGGLVMKFISANPRTKEDCKDGGWRRYGFKNQGQCVRFVETGTDSRRGV